MFPGGPRGPEEPAGPSLPGSPCHWTQSWYQLFALGLFFIKGSDWCVHTYQSSRATRGTTISSSTRQTNESGKSKRTSGSRSTRRTLQTPANMSGTVHSRWDIICLQKFWSIREGTNKDLQLTPGPDSPGGPLSPDAPGGPTIPCSPGGPAGPESPRAPRGPSLPATPAEPGGPAMP